MDREEIKNQIGTWIDTYGFSYILDIIVEVRRGWSENMKCFSMGRSEGEIRVMPKGRDAFKSEDLYNSYLNGYAFGSSPEGRYRGQNTKSSNVRGA